MYPTSLGRFAEPSTIATHFHLHEGDIVADFGAGSGHYMEALSRGVGRSGTVYLCEIQNNLVEALGNKAREQHLSNVHPRWCDFEAPRGTKLADNSLDAGLLSNTLFQVQDKEVALAEIARVIRRGGKLFVIDWSESFGNMGPRPEDVIDEGKAQILLKHAGFTIERTFPVGDHHYGLACRKM